MCMGQMRWPKIPHILELVVRLVHKYGLGEKNVRCLFTHSCYNHATVTTIVTICNNHISLDYLQELFNYTLCCNSVKEQLMMLKMYMQGWFHRYNNIFTSNKIHYNMKV